MLFKIAIFIYYYRKGLPILQQGPFDNKHRKNIFDLCGKLSVRVIFHRRSTKDRAIVCVME